MPQGLNYIFTLVRIVFIVLLVVFANSLVAQNFHICALPLTNAKDFGGRVNCIFQDKTGFIWIGKETGLYRYDGKQLKAYLHNPKDSCSISNNNILAFSEDAAGNLWIGTKGGGLNKYNRATGRFTRYLHSDHNPRSISFNEVHAIQPDGAGHFWIGTDGGGLNFFDPGKEIFQAYPAATMETPGFQSTKILRITPAGNGAYWVGTWNGGIHFFDPARKIIRHLGDGTPYAKSNVYAITEVRKNLLWIATWDQGLIAYDVTTGRFSTVIDTSRVQHFRHLIAGPKGDIWATSTVGLFYFSSPGSAGQKIVDETLPESRDMTHVFIDRAQMVWLGYKNGSVSKINPQRKQFSVVPATFPFSSSPVNAIYSDSLSDQVYFSSWNHLVQFDPVTKAYKNWPSPVSEFVSIRALPGTDSLLCAAPGGLLVFNKKNGHFSKLNFDSNSNTSILKREILTVVAMGANAYSVGASGAAYQIAYDPKMRWWQVQNIWYAGIGKDLPPSHYPSGFIKDGKGNFWVGTLGGGLNVMRNGGNRFVPFVYDVNQLNSISDNFVESIASDGLGVLWAGTHAGLNRFNTTNNTFERITVAEGLSGDWVNAVAMDARKRIWLSSQKGISSVSADGKTIHNYDTDDGLPSNTFLSRAVAAGRHGNLYFGTVRGLVWFHPDSITANPFLPEPVLVDFKVNENSLPVGGQSPLQQSIEVTKEIQLANDQSSFAFQMAALGYFNPTKNSIKYKLVGYDKDWKMAGPDQLAIYSNIKWGTYQFTCMVANEDGVWNPVAKTVTVVVARPFWLSGPALFIYTLLAAGVLIFLFLRKKALEIEAPEFPEPKVKKAAHHELIEPAGIQASPADMQFLQKAILTVEEYMGDPDFNVQQLSEKMFISRPQLYRKINAITGVTITDFIKEIRLKRAAQLILQKPGNISEIAYQVGFNDPKYFSKCFKQQFGVSPVRYKPANERFLPQE